MSAYQNLKKNVIENNIKNAPVQPYPQSTYITKCEFDALRYHQGTGDMWPLTWANDDNMYTGAGDNRDTPMNFWRIKGKPNFYHDMFGLDYVLDVIDDLPIDPKIYCVDPRVHTEKGVKPAGLIEIDDVLYFAVQTQNYGQNPDFNRQTNIQGFIITSKDYGKTWNREATDINFFTGRVASCHFLQLGKGNENTIDGYVYAYFPAGDDGNSYWENGDVIYLGRVPKDKILDRSAWEFFVEPQKWVSDEREAKSIFNYYHMTGENHVSYNKGIGRYIMGNYSFYNPETGEPRPYHQLNWPESVFPTQLTLYEAPNPWGPWKLFYQDNNWGSYGGYQPVFPVKWISDDGKIMFMVSSGSHDDYNFTVQRLYLECNENER